MMRPNPSKEIIKIGREAWERDLVAGRGGNISLRLGERIIMTKSGSCLGMLEESDFVEMDLKGNLKSGEKPSTETPLHLAIYNNTDAKAVVHLHPPLATAYFLENSELKLYTFEEKLFLGNVQAIEQKTPSVTDVEPVIKALKLNNIVVLKNHGVVAIGKDLLDAFFLIQTLEHAVKIELSRSLSTKNPASQTVKPQEARAANKYKLFSREQIEKIVDLINHDENFLKQAQALNLTLTMAVKMDETGEVYRFNFNKGKIIDLSNSEDAEFVINGPRAVWEAIFRRQIDPFVATTQKKLNLKGDFAKLSKWYSPFARLFQLWQQAPIE